MINTNIHIRDVLNGFFKFSSVLKTVGLVFFVDQLKNTKKTCKLSFLCVHFAFCRRFSNPRFHDHLLSDSVRNMKNFKAL